MQQLVSDILTVMGQIGAIGTAIGTIALVILFWKTIQQLEETVKLSKIQANFRFRPWVGPLSRIEHMSTTTDGREQYNITIKNYGELPSSNVIAKFLIRNSSPTRDMVKSDSITSFTLGPLLPNMEKRYWFFVDSKTIEEAKSGVGQIFTLLYFLYEHRDGSSGYGLISKYDSTMNSFNHVDMWTD